jgi:hypothetical protein
MLDGLVAAEVASESAKHFDGPQADQKQMQLEETAGIPTGIAPDIHRQVELRKAKRAAAPDNLVTDSLRSPLALPSASRVVLASNTRPESAHESSPRNRSATGCPAQGLSQAGTLNQ